MSKFLIMGALMLVIIAYLPTLKYDYVTQDQWRAFRYSTLAQNPSFRAEACVKMIPKFYKMTGRPLVWYGECLEHAAVSKIGDFVYLRPFVLLAVLMTVIYAGRVIGPFIGGEVMGAIAFSLFVFSPGYSFMYLQGMTAIMVLFSMLLASASFSGFNRWLDRPREGHKDSLVQLSIPAILFILACMIYSSWAYVVITMALLRFGFDGRNPLPKRFEYLGATLFFYFAASVIYYLYVKVTTMGHHYDLGDYTVSMQFNAGVLYERTKELWGRFYHMPVLNFGSPSGSGAVVVGLFSVNLGLWISRQVNGKMGTAMAWSVGLFLLSMIVLLFSISPWLLSQRAVLPSRNLIPWYLFFCAAGIGLIASVAQNLPDRIKEFIPIVLMVFLLVPLAKIQYSHSFLETAVSKQEIGMLRTALGEWLDEKGYLYDKYLLVVTPSKERPAFVDQLKDTAALQENAVLGSAENPVEIPWMVNAVLREREDHPIGKSLEIINCSFDQDCAKFYLAKGKIVLGLTKGDAAIRSNVAPFIINFSLLTSRPVVPVIKKW